MRAMPKGFGKSCVCVKMKLGSRFAKLPVGYICNEMERVFPGSTAFEYDDSVMGFIEAGSVRTADGKYSVKNG